MKTLNEHSLSVTYNRKKDTLVITILRNNFGRWEEVETVNVAMMDSIKRRNLETKYDLNPEEIDLVIGLAIKRERRREEHEAKARAREATDAEHKREAERKERTVQALERIAKVLEQRFGMLIE